jgi:hypothetical protein
MFLLLNGTVNTGCTTGNKHVTLVEVKSTSDTSYNGMKPSDAKMIKNSKRSAQHQLRDHIELLEASTELGKCKTNGNETSILLHCEISGQWSNL